MSASASNLDAKAPKVPQPVVRRPTRSWGLPLVTKELLELSARPRTFQIRGAFAAVLLLISIIVLYWSVPNYAESPLNVFGVGAQVLRTIVTILFFGLYLILPILACGTLTVEKERKTLELLLITKLGPGTIILEKFLSRLVPALNFVLIAAPVLAFCYALGGIDLNDLFWLTQSLVLTAIQLTAVGVMCSACFRTTTRALVWTYVFLLLANMLEYALFLGGGYLLGIDLTGPLINGARRVSAAHLDPNVQVSTIIEILLNLGPSLLVSTTCLILGRQALAAICFGVAAKASKGWLPRWLAPGDLEEQSRRNQADTPLQNPIAWRESPPAAGLVRWWISRLCGTCLGVALLFWFFSWPAHDFGPGLNFAVSIMIWFILTLWICIAAAAVIVQERTQQTLDILLTTPISGEEIVRQKMMPARRIMTLGRLALALCAAHHLFLRFEFSYLINSAIMIWLYPEVIVWQATVCGLSAKNSTWAILKSLLMLVARCLVPYVIIILGTITIHVDSVDVAFFFACLSPLTLLLASESFPSEFMVIGPFVTFISNGILLLYLKYRVTENAERLLGRLTPATTLIHVGAQRPSSG